MHRLVDALQIVTVLSSLPLPPLPHAARADAAASALTASERGPCLALGIASSSPRESLIFGHVADRGRSVTGTTC